MSLPAVRPSSLIPTLSYPPPSPYTPNPTIPTVIRPIQSDQTSLTHFIACTLPTSLLTTLSGLVKQSQFRRSRPFKLRTRFSRISVLMIPVPVPYPPRIYPAHLIAALPRTKLYTLIPYQSTLFSYIFWSTLKRIFLLVLILYISIFYVFWIYLSIIFLFFHLSIYIYIYLSIYIYFIYQIY